MGRGEEAPRALRVVARPARAGKHPRSRVPAGGRDREGPLAPVGHPGHGRAYRRAHRPRGGPPLRGDPWPAAQRRVGDLHLPPVAGDQAGGRPRQRAPRRSPHPHRARGRDHRRRDRPSHGGPRAHRAVPEGPRGGGQGGPPGGGALEARRVHRRVLLAAARRDPRAGRSRRRRPHRDGGADLRRQAERLRTDLRGRAGGEDPVHPRRGTPGHRPHPRGAEEAGSRPRNVGARQRSLGDPGPPLHRRVHPAARGHGARRAGDESRPREDALARPAGAKPVRREPAEGRALEVVRPQLRRLHLR